MQCLEREIISELRRLPFSVTLLDGHYVHADEHGNITPFYNLDDDYRILFDAHIVLVADAAQVYQRRVRDTSKKRVLDQRIIEIEDDASMKEVRRIATESGAPLYFVENVDQAKAVSDILALLKRLERIDG